MNAVLLLKAKPSRRALEGAGQTAFGFSTARPPMPMPLGGASSQRWIQIEPYVRHGVPVVSHQRRQVVGGDVWVPASGPVRVTPPPLPDAQVGEGPGPDPEFPPRPQHFKAKYTLDEAKNHIWNLENITSYGPAIEWMKAHVEANRGRPGWEAVNMSRGSGYNTNRPPLHELQDSLASCKDWMRHGLRSHLTPAAFAERAEPYLKGVHNHITSARLWATGDLYRKGQSPDAVCDLLAKLHKDYGLEHVDDGRTQNLLVYHGVPERLFQGRFNDGKRLPSDYVAPRYSSARRASIADDLKVMLAHEHREFVKEGLRHRQYFLGLEDVGKALDTIESTGPLSYRRFVAHLTRHGVRADEEVATNDDAVSVTDDRKPRLSWSAYRGFELVLEGVAPGWRFIGPSAATKEEAFDAFTRYVRNGIEKFRADPSIKVWSLR